MRQTLRECYNNNIKNDVFVYLMFFSALTLYDQLKFEIKKWLDYRGNSWKDTFNKQPFLDNIWTT